MRKFTTLIITLLFITILDAPFVHAAITPITRVSTDSAGVQGTGGTNTATPILIYGDGRYVVFSSAFTNLVASDTNTFRDSFVKDLQTGATTRISTDSAGAQATGGISIASGVSADGRYIAFQSQATNLVSGDTNAVYDAFVKDQQTGTTTRVSTDSTGTQGTGGTPAAGSPSISADGRYVVFFTTFTNLVASDTNAQNDVFMKDTQTGVTTRVSTDSAGAQATGGGSVTAYISANGRYVAFQSDATNLVASDTNGIRDSFVKDLQTGITTRVSTDSAGAQATGGVSLVRAITDDGRYVLFESDATNLVAGDTNGTRDVFLKDTVTNVTSRLSVDANGVQATGGGSFNPMMSADARYITFESDATNLVSGDTNALGDTFVKDIQNGTIERISVDSAGAQATGGASSTPSAISSDGRYVAFQSAATNLVSGDTNALDDTFFRQNPLWSAPAVTTPTIATPAVPNTGIQPAKRGLMLYVGVTMAGGLCITARCLVIRKKLRLNSVNN